jgi:hypothetical protein
MSPLAGLDPYCISSVHCVADVKDSESRWKGLAPALAILNQVNPTVATWVRQQHAAGRLEFEDCFPTAGSEDALARYDMLMRRLIVNRQLFSENDGTVAVTLCHEYRHSRQNVGKFCQYVLSFLLSRQGESSIVENDAVLYEQEAHRAIFGDGESRPRALAAWEAAAKLRSQDGRQAIR